MSVPFFALHMCLDSHSIFIVTGTLYRWQHLTDPAQRPRLFGLNLVGARGDCSKATAPPAEIQTFSAPVPTAQHTTRTDTRVKRKRKINIIKMKKIRLEATHMQGKVQTVLGLIDPKEAGYTLPHEHLIHDLPKSVFLQSQTELLPMLKSNSLTLENMKWIRQYPYCFEENIEFCDEATRSAVKEEMHSLKKCCDKVTVVDNCSIGLRAKDHAKYLKEIATDTGVNVVMGTGFYVAGAQTTSTLNMTQEDLADKMRDDILKGVDSTGVKCGVIGEIGCSYPILPFEKRCLYASAAVQRETGCPVILHPGRDSRAPEEILRLFQEAGGKGAKTVMSHLDRTFHTYNALAEFACLGSYCEFDLFGIEVSHYQLNEDFDMPSDAQRIAFLRDLLVDGYDDKIVVSHDVHTKHRLEKFGGHGYSHLFVTVHRKMLYRGISDYDINKIFYTNPQKWLTFESI